MAGKKETCGFIRLLAAALLLVVLIPFANAGNPGDVCASYCDCDDGQSVFSCVGGLCTNGPADYSCTTVDDCCGGAVCVAGECQGLSCSSCRKQWESCNDDGDCCNQGVCVSGICWNYGATCTEETDYSGLGGGGDCNVSSECCQGLVCGWVHHAQHQGEYDEPNYQCASMCANASASCIPFPDNVSGTNLPPQWDSLRCCSGLTCNVPSGQTNGTCSTPCSGCKGQWGSCNDNNDCCQAQGLTCDTTHGRYAPNMGECLPDVCHQENWPCYYTSDCCTGLMCDQTGICKSCQVPPGSGCMTDDDCCSGSSCDSGFCSNPAPPPQCANETQACSATISCCSGQMLSCVNNNCCRNEGGACGGDTDCCSGMTCQSGECHQAPVVPPIVPSGPCASYGQSYSTTLPCCNGLVQSNGKCNQKPGVCTNMPETYVAPPASSSGGSTTNGPLDAIAKLQNGTGIGSNGGGGLGGGSGIYRTGWFNSWQTSGFVGLAIVIAIIAIAAMVGHGFNLPEVKAFVNSELIQAVVSAMLLVGIIALIGGLDLLARVAVNAADLPVACSTGEPCYVSTAKQYLGTLYDTADGYTEEQLKASIERNLKSGLGIGYNGNLIVLLYAGANSRPNAGVSISAERAGAMFETASRLMASIYAQKYFIDVISFGIAPVFLLLGILLRTFFFTRKLGGLLLAIAISLFIVYPLTYAFAWYTLNVTIYGDRMSLPSDPSCPAECTARYPVAFFIDPAGTGKIIAFDTIQSIMRAGINSSNWETGNVDDDPEAEFPGLVSCRNLTEIGITLNSCPNCPDYCRDVPFPSNIPGCNITACSQCNPGCKIMRQRSDGGSSDLCPSTCSEECKTSLPVENKCYVEPTTNANVSANLAVSCQGCEGCPSWCKLIKVNPGGSIVQVYENETACKKPACFPPSLIEPKSGLPGTCPLQCLYKTEFGGSTYCDDSVVCGNCPKICRVIGLNESSPPYSQYDTTTPKAYDICRKASIVNACKNCPDGCKTTILPVPTSEDVICAEYPVQNPPAVQNCVDCPESCRWEGYGYLSDSPPEGSFADSAVHVPAGNAVPVSCEPGSGTKIDCSASACASSCKAPATGPALCKKFDGSAADANWCQSCPESARVLLNHTNVDGSTEQRPPNVSSSYNCEDSACPQESCFHDYASPFTIPSQPDVAERACPKILDESCDSNAESGDCCAEGLFCNLTSTNCTLCASQIPIGGTCLASTAGCCASGSQCIGGVCTAYCKDYDASFSGTPYRCERCPIGCRVSGGVSAYLSSSECSMCGDSNCPSDCKADLSGVQGQVCEIYLGNGMPVDPDTPGPNGQYCAGPGICDTLTSSACLRNSSCSWSVPGSAYSAPIE